MSGLYRGRRVVRSASCPVDESSVDELSVDESSVDEVVDAPHPGRDRVGVGDDDEHPGDFGGELDEEMGRGVGW